MRNRQIDNREKKPVEKQNYSFNEQKDIPIDFSKIRIGAKNLDDAILDLGTFKKISNNGNKDFVLQALHNHDYKALREISNLFYETSGIYSRLCKYIAYLYRFDWYLVPYINDNKVKEDKVLSDFSKILKILDSSYISKLCGDISLSVVKNGCYYGYIVQTDTGFFMQDLPIDYCRSRFNKNGLPTVEFNMKYFDDQFMDVQYRMRILKTFPKDFTKGYLLFKQNKLKPDFMGDTNGWYLLDPEYSVKINCANSDFPILVNAIPAIIELDEAQALDRKKQMQKLLKIIIQKLPLDKNGDLIFDMDEAADLHNNAVTMLKRAVGVDVLTTFADIDVADMADKNTATTSDDLSKVERTVYNEFGVSRNLFNSDSNLALTNSILDDEASIRSLPQQLEIFINKIVDKFNTNPKKYYFKFNILETTIYNYKEVSKMYKDQVQIGYSKMLPQIALGHSQSEIIAMAHFENSFLHLNDIMIPPLMSSTMSNKESGSKKQKTDNENNESVGRPEKSDAEKSDKTILNKESM